jgi:ABC-type nitrate/sulfonate/bicarbonate transport system permease component
VAQPLAEGTNQVGQTLWHSASRMRFRAWPRLNRWQVLGLVLFLLVWEAFAWHVFLENPRRGNTMFPRLEYIATVSFPEFATYYGIDEGLMGFRTDPWLATRVLVENSIITARRVVIGVSLGIALGVGIGLLVGWSRWARDLIVPPVLLLRTIPILALIPLFMFWFGAREIGILIYITFAVFAMMIINTLEAIRNVPPLYTDYARCMGATRWQVYRTIVAPAIVPALAGGIQVILGISWAIALAGELLATDSGLGWLMILSERFLMTGRMVVIVVIFVAFSLIVNKLFLWVSDYLSRWVPRAERA